MKRYALIFKIMAAAIIASGCSSAEKIDVVSPSLWGGDSGTVKSSPRRNTRKPLLARVHGERKLLRPRFRGPVTLINNRAVDEILSGNYDRAETLLLEIKALDTTGSAYNNLAVIYELSGRKKLAFTAYYGALLYYPDNIDIKNNLFSFLYSTGKIKIR